mgnify:CR=1 FL=1
MKTLYPDISPFNSDFLVQGYHKIYFEESGNPDGKPVVFLHGGPGGGGDKNVRRFFNPELYRIVNFDQRGCGRSKPHGLLEENTTWHLVEDIEAIREKLNIDSWMVFGGSWGSTLALTYAQTHPEKVSEMVLRGIFLLRKKELDWFYQEGASKIFPDSWQKFIKVIEPDKRHNLMNAYYEIFKGTDKQMKEKAAVAWSQWEAATSSILINEARIEGFSNIDFAIAFATIETAFSKSAAPFLPTSATSTASSTKGPILSSAGFNTAPIALPNATTCGIGNATNIDAIIPPKTIPKLGADKKLPKPPAEPSTKRA